jgi:hypothetical protein
MKQIIINSILIMMFICIGVGCVDSNNRNSNAPSTQNIDSIDENSTDTTIYANITFVNEYGIDFKSTNPYNKAAYITSQCYTKTKDENGNIYNPCFSCHINSSEPNYVNDWDLQESNSFSEYSHLNRFSNLFKDRTIEVAAISDSDILEYIQEDNYIDEQGNIILSQKLSDIPQIWDINQNGKWDGYTPDCYFNFDSDGFDKTPNGDYTLWRALGYYPFLGTFWPTNGSTDDVMIRLPDHFSHNSSGTFDIETYKINLSIVEALIKKMDIHLGYTIDETIYEVDLNQDGLLGLSDTIVYNWEQPIYNTVTATLSNFSMSYVGKAKDLLISNDYLIAPGLYPKDTEFLHTVRYIGIDQASDTIQMAPRMKELRYAKKNSWNTYSQILNATNAEIKEKDLFPDRLRTISGNTEEGLYTGLGWVYQGFIEDADGSLRPQNYEETQYCIGCHSGIGAIADSTFVFQRKFNHTHFQKGWYHWSQDHNGLKNIPEPLTKDAQYEYTLYLEANKAGDEFRSNTEVIEKFFDENGNLKDEQIAILRDDISHLLYPSKQRALQLNKAYKVIVNEQSYIYGRDSHIKPIENVYKEIEIDSTTGIDAIQY